MDLFYDILLWLHILAIVAGGSNAVAMPFVGAKLEHATPETRDALFSIAASLSRIGRIAMIVLLVTGPVMLWMRFGGLSGATNWFWIKMALILLMLVSIVVGGINFKKARQGDLNALEIAETAGRITSVAFVGVLLSAVFAFN